MFSFYFVNFLFFFWLIFKCFCFVLTYKSTSYSTIFSLVDLLCPFLSILLYKFVFVWPSPYCLLLMTLSLFSLSSLSLYLLTSLAVCDAPNPTIKIGMWQPPHAYKVSTLKVCKAFLATKIYPQKLKSNKSKIPQ